ncbi:hypothetical protein D3C83_244430 [compost metagenome]
MASDADFRLSRADIDAVVDPRAFTGRSAEQVAGFIAAEVDPVLEHDTSVRAAVEEPRV